MVSIPQRKPLCHLSTHNSIIPRTVILTHARREIAEPYLVAANQYTVADPSTLSSFGCGPLSEPRPASTTAQHRIVTDEAAYGRYLLPHHPPTQALLNTPRVRHHFRRVFLKPFRDCSTWHEAYTTTDIIHSEEVEITEAEIAEGVKHGGRWIFYSIWEMDEPEGGWELGGKGRDRDLVLVHGQFMS